jgi:hypothetical protein
MKILFSFIAIIFICQPALAETSDAEQSKEMATKLAECGGVFSAMSNVMEGIGKKNAAQTYGDTARGAYLAGAFSNHMAGNIPKWENAVAWSENIKESQKTYWLGLIELYTPTKEKVFPDDFMETLKFCTSLNPLQTELVQMMREAIYSQE